MDEQQVLMYDSQSHQELTLVFVDTLGLYVEHRGGIDVDGGDSIHDSRQSLLVGALDRPEPVLKLGVVRKFLDRAQLLEVDTPARANSCIEQIRQTRIRSQQPSPL